MSSLCPFCNLDALDADPEPLPSPNWTPGENLAPCKVCGASEHGAHQYEPAPVTMSDETPIPRPPGPSDRDEVLAFVERVRIRLVAALAERDRYRSALERHEAFVKAFDAWAECDGDGDEAKQMWRAREHLRRALSEQPTPKGEG